MSDIMNKQSTQTSRALRVLFLAGGQGLAAQLAAHWTWVFAGDSLQAQAAGFGSMDRTPDLNHDQASLVVVIHTPRDREPVVLDHCGGRIDWHLEIDSGSEGLVQLSSQLRGHVMRLLADLGVTPTRFAMNSTQRHYSSMPQDLPVPPLASTRPQNKRPGTCRMVDRM
jgi:hypothetical protein